MLHWGKIERLTCMSNLAVSGVNQNISSISVNNRQNASGTPNSSASYYRGNLDYPPDTVQFKGQEVKEKKKRWRARYMRSCRLLITI